jgi:hypothetical protein
VTPAHSIPVRTPDTKDWTWVLERPCPECGFASGDITPAEISERLLSSVEQIAGAMDRTDVRERPDPDTWSPLEYACHVRDVCRVYLERLQLMLAEDDPHFPDWDQDATAVEVDYAGQDPETVRIELLARARELADAWDAVDEDSWFRTGNRGDGARFTVLTLGRYLVHDPAHHAWDVTGALQGRPRTLA